MRLIDTETLSLVQKRDDERKRYAILSHIWGRDDEEVTLQDMMAIVASRGPNDEFRDSRAQRPGFKKIQNAARVARLHHQEFIWIDTCCIDKTSSAELSEAINSMFCWYRDATQCYTFLEDVDYDSHGERQHTTETLLLNLVEQIKESRWLKRGWTLQELIAPHDISFYSSTWSFIGNKGTLLDPLCEITGIDRQVLDGTLMPDDFSIASRMAWASNRQTTRVEDLAYCLMGIFNVNMPLLYGEGARSFIRLQEEILRNSNDHSIFAWICPENDPSLSKELFGLLAERPSWFRHSAEMTPLASLSGAPSSLTNLGLHVQFRLVNRTHNLDDSQPRENHGIYLAILDCSCSHTIESKGVFLGPAIKLLSLGGKQFARVQPTHLFLQEYETELQDPTGGEYTSSIQYVYVKQNPTRLLPDLSLKHGPWPTHASWGCELTEARVFGRWDPATLMGQCRRWGDQGLLGIFRYSLTSFRPTPWQVNVLVGLKPGSNNDYWVLVEEEGHGASYRMLRDVEVSKDVVMSSTRSQAWGPISAQVSTTSGQDSFYRIVLTISFRVPTNIEFDDKVTYVIPRKSTTGELEDHFLARHFWKDVSQTSHAAQGLPLSRPIRKSFGENQDHWSIRCQSETVIERFLFELKRISDVDLGFPRNLRFSFKFPAGGVMISESRGGSATTQLFQACRGGNLAWVKNLVIGLEAKYINSSMWATFSSSSGLPISGWGGLVNGFTPLIWATVKCHLNIVQELLSCGADPFKTTAGQLTCLHFACMLGEGKIVHEILSVDRLGWKQMLKAIPRDTEHPINLVVTWERSKPVLEQVLDAFCDARIWPTKQRNYQGETPLHRAAAMNNTIAIEALLRRSPLEEEFNATEEVDVQGRTPLWHAAAAGACEAMDMLIKKGANPDSRDNLGRSVLHAACRHGKIAVVNQLLCDNRVRIDARTIYEPVYSSRNNRPIEYTAVDSVMYATLSGDLNILVAVLRKRELLFLNEGDDSREDLDYRYKFQTLHIAAANGWTLRAVLDENNRLHFRSRTREFENEYYHNLRTNLRPLHIAAANGWMDGVKTLCQAGYETDLALKARYVVMTKASRGEETGMEGRLGPSKSGTDELTVEEYEPTGLTPFEIAERHKHRGVAAYLQWREKAYERRHRLEGRYFF